MWFYKLPGFSVSRFDRLWPQKLFTLSSMCHHGSSENSEQIFRELVDRWAIRMPFGRDPDLCYWIIILSLAMTMKQIERFQVSLSGFRFIGVNDTESLLIWALFLLTLRELYVCVSTSCCVLTSTSFPHGVHQELPWMPKTSAATSQRETGPYLQAAMKLPGWWHGWWSGRAPASTVTHSGKLIAVYLCVCLSWAVSHKHIRRRDAFHHCIAVFWKIVFQGREMEGRQVFSVQGDWNINRHHEELLSFLHFNVAKKMCCCDAALFPKTPSYFGSPFHKLFHQETPRHSILKGCLMNSVYLCQLAL